jgi:hypothetical protein
MGERASGGVEAARVDEVDGVDAKIGTSALHSVYYVYSVHYFHSPHCPRAVSRSELVIRGCRSYSPGLFFYENHYYVQDGQTPSCP